MEIKRWTTMRFNMGPYESYEFGGSVGITHHELGYTDDDLTDEASTTEVAQAMVKYLDNIIEKALSPDIRLAAELTQEDSSYAVALTKAADAEPPPPKRRRRAAR